MSSAGARGRLTRRWPWCPGCSFSSSWRGGAGEFDTLSGQHSSGRSRWLRKLSGTSSCASPRRLLEEFLFFGFARAVRTWKIGALFLYDLVSGSLSSVSGCCVWNTEHWILREMTLSVGAMLGSTVDTGFATVLGFWTIFTQFLRCRGLQS